MGSDAVHLALREMRAHFSDPRVLGGMAVVAVLLGVAGPFGTFEQLPLAQRLAYWGAVVVATYGVGVAVALLLANLFGSRLRQPWARVLVFGALIGLPVTLAMLGINLIAFGHGPGDLAELWLQCTLIGLGVMTISEIVGDSLRAATGAAVGIAASPAEQPPPILERVPLPQRGRLRALVVEDHYVEVVTDRGRTLLLMRLSDAIREAGGVRGVQIHRSHWVALDAVARVLRVEGKVFVELPEGRRLAVSRGYMDAAKAAGLVV